MNQLPDLLLVLLGALLILVPKIGAHCVRYLARGPFAALTATTFFGVCTLMLWVYSVATLFNPEGLDLITFFLAVGFTWGLLELE